MANIVETDNWPGGVYLYADGDELDGGPDSSETLPLKQLAQRSLFQRLRNVTDWDAGLAAGFGYPAGAVVRHAAVSWRAKVANAVDPGSDATQWERWGYSESELDERLGLLLPYGAPVACTNTGPDGVADKSKIHKSPLGEYWMWLGDAWKVVASLYGVSATGGSVAVPTAEVFVTAGIATMPRAGFIGVSGSFRFVQVSTASISLLAQINKNGVRAASDGTPHSQNQVLHAAPSVARLQVGAGDVISLLAYKSGGGASDIVEGVSFTYQYLE